MSTWRLRQWAERDDDRVTSRLVVIKAGVDHSSRMRSAAVCALHCSRCASSRPVQLDRPYLLSPFYVDAPDQQERANLRSLARFTSAILGWRRQGLALGLNRPSELSTRPCRDQYTSSSLRMSAACEASAIVVGSTIDVELVDKVSFSIIDGADLDMGTHIETF